MFSDAGTHTDLGERKGSCRIELGTSVDRGGPATNLCRGFATPSRRLPMHCMPAMFESKELRTLLIVGMEIVFWQMWCVENEAVCRNTQSLLCAKPAWGSDHQGEK